MRDEPDEGAGFNEGFCNGDGDGQPIRCRGAASEFVDKHETMGCRVAARQIAQDESDLAHFSREGRHGRLGAVVGRDPSEEIVDHRQRGVCRWDEGAGLSHHCSQCYAPDVRAFPAHVAPRDDLEASLGCGEDVVRHESVGCRGGMVATATQDLLTDGVSAGFDGEGGVIVVGDFRLHVFAGCDELCEAGEHVEHGDALADLEQRLDPGAYVLDHLLNAVVTHTDHFVVRVFELLVHLDQVQRLALDEFAAFKGIDEDLGKRAVLQFCRSDADVVLARIVEFQLEVDFGLV
jgi:hypothetical protein